MKIAIVSDDGQAISAHFGRATLYLVVTVENGGIIGREVRPKAARHGDGALAKEGDDGSHDSAAAHARHDAMIAPIADCTWLIARGMGRGAYERITAAGINAVITDLVDSEEAAIECAAGRIVNLVDRLH